jgi:hypothetical protein
MNLDNSKVPNAYFIDGFRGMGKVTFTNASLTNEKKMGYNLIPVSWTRIATVLLSEGRAVVDKVI